jgi:hypothetical protein
VPPTRIQHRRHLVLEHRHVAGDHCIRIRSCEYGPRIQAHARIDRRSVLTQVDVGTANGDLVDGASLLAWGADGLREGRAIEGR